MCAFGPCFESKNKYKDIRIILANVVFIDGHNGYIF